MKSFAVPSEDQMAYRSRTRSSSPGRAVPVGGESCRVHSPVALRSALAGGAETSEGAEGGSGRFAVAGAANNIRARKRVMGGVYGIEDRSGAGARRCDESVGPPFLKHQTLRAH